MAIPPRTAGRPKPGMQPNYDASGAPIPEPQLDPYYDKDENKSGGGSNTRGGETNKNVNTVKGGNVTIGDVGSNNITRINAKNKAQEYMQKREAAESDEAKADTDADVSDESGREKSNLRELIEKERELSRAIVKERDFPERSVTYIDNDGRKGGFTDYRIPKDRRAVSERTEESGFMYGGSGGYNFKRGGGRTPMRKGAGIRRTSRG